ncbi:MAG: beta-N-acetylglucosaminidase domain-containing protein [Akkermansia sp.]|nr:beta-N-acetylglucosaminidase domain-containing protein [Akkermansia sp.]
MNTHILTAATALACVPALIAPAMATSTKPIYPTPKHLELQTGTIHATEVEVLLRTPESTGELWNRLPAKEGGYAIEITPQGKVRVLANDETGRFYAKQTLSQMLRNVAGAADAHKDPYPKLGVEEVARLGQLPIGTVVDWPDLRYRGVVEGYYGIPWSYEARQSQFRFYGRNKMNMYIYAPKDDPLHHGLGCYQAYPESKALEIAALVRCARENHVRFVWAIHPANTVRWEENNGRTQMDALCAKLQKMYELGVRDFGVLVDDSFGEIGKPERQVQLCNYILENFIRKHPDVNQELIMCPTGYNRSWTTPKFLNTIGEGLHKDIHIMWTGNTVVHDITLEGQQWVNQHVQRPTFIWWNWPCNDFKPSRLSMGRTYGLGQEPEMLQAMSGFVANPMERAEASKVGLYGVAAYTWNIAGFDSERTWKDGITRLYPRCAAAMQNFCEHNSDLLPNGHNYLREESVCLGDLPNRLRNSITAGQPDPELCEKMISIFSGVASAGEKLKATRDIGALQREIGPWLEAYESMGLAGIHAMRGLLSHSLPERLDVFFRLVDKLQSIKDLRRDAWVNDHVEQVNDVQVGSFALTPTVMTAYNYLNASIYAPLSGMDFRAFMPQFSTNAGNANENAANLADNNLSSYWLSGAVQKEGDWFCLDFGEPMPVRTVKLLQADRVRSQHFAKKGQLEYSPDGTTWTPLGEPTTGPNVMKNLTLNPIQARMLRFRILEPQPRRRLALCEFSVNTPLPCQLSNTIGDLKGLSAYNDDTSIALCRIMESAKAQPGGSIALEFPTPVQATQFVIDFDNARLSEWAKLEFTLPDGSKHSPTLQRHEKSNIFYIPKEDMPQSPIAAIRFTHIGSEAQDIRVNQFVLTTPFLESDAQPANLTDCDFSTFFNTGENELKLKLAVPQNAHVITLVGTADCKVEGAAKVGQDGMLSTYRINHGVTHITITAAKQPGTRMYEAVFN